MVIGRRLTEICRCLTKSSVLQAPPLFFSIRSSRMGQYPPPISTFKSNYKMVASNGEPWGFLGRGVPPGSPNLDPITDQQQSFSKPIFRPDLQNPHLFSDLGFRQKLCHNYLDKSAKKIASNAFHIRIFLFLSYSFGIETINTFKGFLSFLENHTRFQTKMGNSDQKAQTFGQHIPKWFIKRVYPPQVASIC